MVVACNFHGFGRQVPFRCEQTPDCSVVEAKGFGFGLARVIAMSSGWKHNVEVAGAKMIQHRKSANIVKKTAGCRAFGTNTSESLYYLCEFTRSDDGNRAVLPKKIDIKGAQFSQMIKLPHETRLERQFMNFPHSEHASRMSQRRDGCSNAVNRGICDSQTSHTESRVFFKDLDRVENGLVRIVDNLLKS